jgi:integrase
MLVNECQKALDAAFNKVGIPRLTHHDARHLFATRCIESGVDVPTVAGWMSANDNASRGVAQNVVMTLTPLSYRRNSSPTLQGNR